MHTQVMHYTFSATKNTNLPQLKWSQMLAIISHAVSPALLLKMVSTAHAASTQLRSLTPSALSVNSPEFVHG